MKTIFTRVLCLAFVLGFIVPAANAVIVLPRSSAQPDATTVRSATESFKSLSKKEKREKIREVKKAVKEYKALKKQSSTPVASSALQIIFAILLPPLGVYLHEGEINSRFWIDLLLTLLFYLPGMIYALVIVLGD